MNELGLPASVRTIGAVSIPPSKAFANARILRRLLAAPFLICIIAAHLAMPADTPALRPVESILADYIAAVGGLPAVDHLTSREISADIRRGPKITIFWQKPNKVLAISKRERTGYDGSSGWSLSKKRKVKKLARSAELPIELDANPLRYVHIRDIYSELDPAPREDIDGAKMDVILAPNNIAVTKLYFDADTHLLRRVAEQGETSAYFRNTVDYLDYRQVDGVRLPFRIVHSTTEPGGQGEDLRVKKIAHNVELQPEIFSKPLPAQVVMGGKR
jgi:hypothetical protein